MNRTLGLLRWYWEHLDGCIAGNPEEIALSRIEAMRLVAAIPGPYAAALRMRVGFGATCKQIGRIQGITHQAASYRCGRAMLELKYLSRRLSANRAS